VNPWVRTAEAQVRAEVKHYYGQRIRDPEFWRKLLAGEVAVGAAVSGYLQKLVAARAAHPGRRKAEIRDDLGFRERMVAGLQGFEGPVMVCLSGRDLVAAEFRDFCADDLRMAAWLKAATTTCTEFPQADHTFSSRADRCALEDASLAWLDIVNGKAT
jgi:hypothetical protein